MVVKYLSNFHEKQNIIKNVLKAVSLHSFFLFFNAKQSACYISFYASSYTLKKSFELQNQYLYAALAYLLLVQFFSGILYRLFSFFVIGQDDTFGFGIVKLIKIRFSAKTDGFLVFIRVVICQSVPNIPSNIRFLQSLETIYRKHSNSELLQKVFRNDFAPITPWLAFKLRNLHNRKYISP